MNYFTVCVEAKWSNQLGELKVSKHILCNQEHITKLLKEVAYMDSFQSIGLGHLEIKSPSMSFKLADGSISKKFGVPCTKRGLDEFLKWAEGEGMLVKKAIKNMLRHKEYLP